MIVLGHTYYDGRHSHLNIPGPDLDEREFGKLFEGLKAREQLFLITTPASGFFFKPLAASGRTRHHGDRARSGGQRDAVPPCPG